MQYSTSVGRDLQRSSGPTVFCSIQFAEANLQEQDVKALGFAGCSPPVVVVLARARQRLLTPNFFVNTTSLHE